MKIKIPVARPVLNGNELKYVTKCIKTNWISSVGKYVEKFEEDFAGYCGTKYAVSTFNCTVALHLALVAIGIKRGDEVIIPDLTFVATANAVSYIGARPVFVDIDEETWCINTEKISQKITKRTKAIIPVHLYGHPADMNRVLEIAREHKLFVIEDAAEALGAEYKYKKAGSIGDAACFSFYGNKIITTGEGGMLVTDNRKLADTARFLRNQAMSDKRKYWHPCIGYNYRMTNLQAAVGCAQLERINNIISKKRKNAAIYSELLKDVEGIKLPCEKGWAKSVFWMYSIIVEKEYGLSRERLAGKLAASGIETRPVFVSMHRLPNYKEKNRYPVSEKVSVCGLTLPSGADLKRSDIEYVTEKIKKFKSNKKTC